MRLLYVVLMAVCLVGCGRNDLADGKAFFDSGDYDTARACFSRVIASDPGNGVAYYYRGQCSRRQRKCDEAIKDYTEAIRLSPADANALAGRALAYLALQNHADAVRDADAATKIDPDLPGPYIARGHAKLTEALASGYKPSGMDALGQFDRAIELSPDKPEYYESRAVAWDFLGSKEKEAADKAKAESLRKR